MSQTVPEVSSKLAVEPTTENERESTSDTVGAEESESVNTCEQCKAKPHKYKCPRCGKQTCSLICVKQHKKQDNCSGERDRTKFISVKEFSEKDLISDLKLLESISRTAESARRQGSVFGANMNRARQTSSETQEEESSKESGKGTRKRKRGSRDDRFKRLPQKLKQLVLAAEDRGTELVLMPLGMSRRAKNSSVFDKDCGTIKWRVDVNLCRTNEDVQGAKSGANAGLGLGNIVQSCSIDQVDEKDSIRSIVEKSQRRNDATWSKASNFSVYIRNESRCLPPPVKPKLSSDIQETDLEQPSGPAVQETAMENTSLLATSTHDPSLAKFQLDVDASLCENLKNKVIVEYPILFVKYET